MEVLIRIKRLIITGRYRFSEKAADELEIDGLEFDDAIESILNAKAIKKVIRSRAQGHQGQRLYVIHSRNFTGTSIYTKGAIRQQDGESYFYIFVSAKRAI